MSSHLKIDGLCAALGASLLLLSNPALSADEAHVHPAPAAASEHEQHNHVHSMNAEVKRSMVEVTLADSSLVRQDGARVSLKSELEDGKPVILAFIYTSCTTICPVTSQILSRTQNLLGKDIDKVHIVSVSIDPEYDTPARLLAYSKKFGAKPQWQHYTGSINNSVAVQKEFGVYRGDKMNHEALLFVGGVNKKSWAKFEGFPSAEQVVKEYREQSGG
jgi:protein SCO1/2